MTRMREGGKEMTSTLEAEYVETIVIGGGQAGLAAGYHLRRHGRPVLIPDAGGPGGTRCGCSLPLTSAGWRACHFRLASGTLGGLGTVSDVRLRILSTSS